MSSSKSIWLLAAAAMFIASPAVAQQSPTADAATDVTADPIAGADIVNDDELGELRGGEAMIITNQTLVAITSGNVINGDYVAGNISLSDFALSNFNGLGNMLINSGAQVSLQTGMNVTINVGE